MNDTEQKLNSLKKQLKATRRKENELQNEIEKLTTVLEKNVKVGDCFEYSSTFIRILDIQGNHVKYINLYNDIQHGEVSFDARCTFPIDFLLSTYTRITEERFLQKLDECLNAAFILGTNK